MKIIAYLRRRNSEIRGKGIRGRKQNGMRVKEEILIGVIETGAKPKLLKNPCKLYGLSPSRGGAERTARTGRFDHVRFLRVNKGKQGAEQEKASDRRRSGEKDRRLSGASRRTKNTAPYSEPREGRSFE